MLRYTGHPFIDVGVATLVVACGVKNPNEITETQLADTTERLLEIYTTPPISAYLGYVVFANAPFANPAQVYKPQYDQARREVLRDILQLYKHPIGQPLPPSLSKEEPVLADESCVFSGDQAVIRASRNLVPMTSGADIINFVPEGNPKLPISGWCVLALLAMPMGTLNSNGKIWLLHSSDHNLIQHFAEVNYQRNLEKFQLEGLNKLPNYKFAKTHLLNGLSLTQGKLTRNSSITAYLFTSSGQKSEITIYHLPSNIVEFIRSAQKFCKSAWDRVVARAWDLNGQPEEKDGVIIYNERNYFYEDLFDLPQNAHAFLRRYLLRQPQRGKPSGKQKFDPRYEYHYLREREVIDWELTKLFLERIMNIPKARIDEIAKLADGLADYIRQHDGRLFKRLFLARNDYTMRLELLKAASSAKDSTGDEALLPYERFIQVFFADDGETVRPDWYLARDLLMIRIIERLHQEQWLEKNPELVAEVDEEITKQTSPEQ